MNSENDRNQQQAIGRYRPNLCLYHANAKGTGSAVKMNLHPAHDNTDGCIMLMIANQLTVGNRLAPQPTFATFDWENAICVKLDFGDLTQILQVMRGECESVSDGKGLYHRSHKAATSVRFCHRLEPVPGYLLEICRKPVGGEGEECRACFVFSQAEALGVCEAVTGVLGVVAFGIPMLVPHDTTAYRNALRAQRGPEASPGAEVLRAS